MQSSACNDEQNLTSKGIESIVRQTLSGNGDPSTVSEMQGMQLGFPRL